MNTRGALVIDPVSGDAQRQPGFVVNAAVPTKVTIHGNYTKGFFVSFTDAGIELGPYPDPGYARVMADRYAGILERAN